MGTSKSVDSSRTNPDDRASAASWLVFPVLLGSVIAATLYLLSTELPRPAVAVAILLTNVILMLALERVAPLHRAWNAKPERLDLILIVANRLVDAVVLGGTTWVVGRLDAAGFGLALWPTHWPLLGQALLGVVIGEFIRYLFHRASHAPGLLGRIHHWHHEPGRMYTLNGPRLHPGNQLWIDLANVVPMLVLGASLDAVVLAIAITIFFVLFQHANVNLRFDGLNVLFATPDAHRLHHLRANQGRPVNYGIVFLLFDVAFGSWAPAVPRVDADGIGPDA